MANKECSTPNEQLIMSFCPSDFTKDLTSEQIVTYVSQLSSLGITDPYNAPGVLFTSMKDDSQDLPDLQYPDIYNYLINFPSHYTGDSLRAYKSLDSYKWNLSGFVNNPQIWRLPAKKQAVLMARVNHSQRLNDPQLKPWVLVTNDGIIRGAHCNCMAGLGGSCSHMASLLFKVLEINNSQQPPISVTSKKCKWSQPSREALKKVEYAEGKRIVFNNTQRAKKMRIHNNQESVNNIPPLQEDEKDSLYSSLEKCCTQKNTVVKPAILSIVKGHANRYEPAIVKMKLPNPLTTLYDKSNRDLLFPELLEKAEATFDEISISREQSDVVEEETRQQSCSQVWYDQRAGRITASNFRAAIKTDVNTPSVSLIRRICYPKSHSFTTEATRWGCKHEDTARKAYDMMSSKKHQDLHVVDAGFRISPLHPFIGASPDAYVSCSCCGTGILEIKCPFCAKDTAVKDATDTVKNFCLQNDTSGKPKLKEDHAYYYQVQMQLFVTDRSYCDFVVWTAKDELEPFVQRITADVAFFEAGLERATLFLKKAVLPELLAKHFSAPRPHVYSGDQRWCYCLEPESGNMLQCTSGFCKIERFHQECLRIKKAPRSKWVCPACKKIINKQKRENKKKANVQS